MSTKIEWTDDVWNPIVGCSKVSEGCENCYAERMACRLASMASLDNDKDVFRRYADVTEFKEGAPQSWNEETAFVQSALDKPLQRKKPTTYFVCDMGDLFHESVRLDWIDRVFDVMAACPQHTFLLLTKRPQNIMHKIYGYDTDEKCPARVLGPSDYLPNVYIGVTVENQKQADERIPRLLQIPAAGRFVSCEPLLGPIDLTCVPHPHGWRQTWDEISDGVDSLRHQSARLDQVIAGGESGPNARRMEIDWVRKIRDQCKEAHVPFFYKQDSGKKPTKMTELDGKVHNELIWRR